MPLPFRVDRRNALPLSRFALIELARPHRVHALGRAQQLVHVTTFTGQLTTVGQPRRPVHRAKPASPPHDPSGGRPGGVCAELPLDGPAAPGYSSPHRSTGG